MGIDVRIVQCVLSWAEFCERLGEAKPPKNYPKSSPPTFGIAYEGFIFGQAIFYIENGYILSVPET